MPDASSPERPTPARDRTGTRSGIRLERSAGGVVVRPTEDGARILLIRDPYGKWGLPKGHLEGEEGPREAALREVTEETGLSPLVLGPDLGEIDWMFRLHGRRIHKYCRFYLMASFRGGLEPQVTEGITDCRWLAPEGALRDVSYDNARNMIRRALDHLDAPPEPGQLPW